MGRTRELLSVIRGLCVIPVMSVFCVHLVKYQQLDPLLISPCSIYRDYERLLKRGGTFVYTKEGTRVPPL